MQQSLNYPSFGSVACVDLGRHRITRLPGRVIGSTSQGWKLQNAATSFMHSDGTLTSLCAEESELFFLIGEKWPALRRQATITDLEVLAGV
jgi:hypothetical protein